MHLSFKLTLELFRAKDTKYHSYTAEKTLNKCLDHLGQYIFIGPHMGQPAQDTLAEGFFRQSMGSLVVFH